MKDRIEIIYVAIDQIASAHNNPRPAEFGGGIWNFDEEIILWKKQIIGHEEEQGHIPLTKLQWSIINNYIELKRNKLKGGK